jgi:hypothetical protein
MTNLVMVRDQTDDAALRQSGETVFVFRVGHGVLPFSILEARNPLSGAMR